VQVKNSGGTVIASYAHDGLGRRVQETHSGTVNDPLRRKWHPLICWTLGLLLFHGLENNSRLCP
jgi:hypothetical protein